MLAASWSGSDADSWQQMGPRGGKIYCVAVHPTSSNTIYAALKEGLYRSTDGGESWERLPTSWYALEVVLDPFYPNIIYARTSTRLYRSTDAGETWEEIAAFRILSFAIDPRYPERLFVGTDNGFGTGNGFVYRSTDRGDTWIRRNTGSWCSISSLAVSSGDSNTVYAGTQPYEPEEGGDGIYRTTDGGLTWQSVGLPHCIVGGFAVDPSDPLVVYAIAGCYGSGGGPVFKSTDGGDTWEPTGAGLASGGFIETMTVDPTRPGVVYAGMYHGLYKTTTGGSAWFPVDTGIDEGDIRSISIYPLDTDVVFLGGTGVFRSEAGGQDVELLGVVPVDISSVVVDRDDSQTIFAIGKWPYKTTDYGAHWQPINNGMGEGLVIVQDPADAQVLYGGSYHYYYGGVYKTTDAGATWQASLRDVAINDIEIAPTEPRIVFAGGLEDPYVGGLFRSEDAGNTWTTVDQTQASCIAVDPTDAAIVYAGGSTGLRKSVDGGDTWFPIENGLNLPASGWVLALAIHPHFTNVVYCGTSEAGVFKSVDGGAHWVNVSEGIEPTPLGHKDIQALLIDPTDANVLYAGTWWEKGVFVTVDGGLTWYPLGSASGARSSVDLALDRDNPEVLYSAGGGLWRYVRTSTAPSPEITSYDPPLVLPDNCAGGCVVSFNIGVSGIISPDVAAVTLERQLGGGWIQEDALVTPIPTPPWTLHCSVNEHYTDGEHVFRAAIRCKDGSKAVSKPVVVTADRGVPVAISAFESIYLNGKVTLRWVVRSALGLQGFNLYRSPEQDGGFSRINEQLIPIDQGSEYIDTSVTSGETYWYRLGAVSSDGEWMSQTVSITVPRAALALHQNHPNPFNPATTISFTLPEKARVTLAIYDVKGRLVRTLVDEMVGEGYQERAWDGEDASGTPVGSGVYFYRLTAGDKTLTKKMVLLK